jgi:hypothetical protein
MGALLIKLIVGVIIVTAFGGRENNLLVTGDAEMDKALDAMKFENAPTLGSFYRKCLVAEYNGDGEWLWENISSATHDQEKKSVEYAKKSLPEFDKSVKLLEDKIARLYGYGEDATAELRRQLEHTKTLRERLPKMDAREWFMLRIKFDALRMKEYRKKAAPETQVIEEKIAPDGKSGFLTARYKNGVFQERLKFVKENGEWKYDVYGKLSP